MGPTPLVPPKDRIEKRRRWMSVLAQADSEDVLAFWERYPNKPDYTILQGPDTGLVMVQACTENRNGRFFLGEVTVTKCVVALRQGTVGVSMILGRRPRHAEIAAVLDAELQDSSKNSHLMETLVEPLAKRRHEAERREAVRVASTRVDFMTMVRGE
ncbi:MAG: phosphonate C-P lyase system protein PhnG [Desulfosoma sp.]